MTLFSHKPAAPDEDPRRREDRSRERMFLEHYSWLRECALNITHGERERSEDLVHDVFLQFLDKDMDIASIADIRGYLNGILRNLHLLQLRRAMRRPVQQLSLLDHDSARVGLRAWSYADQLLSADSLVRACDFACYRKESSLAVSILILRYFHGFYPAEICQLLKTRRKLVYRWIDRGRAETKGYMESPYPLPGIGNERNAVAPVGSPQAFLRGLRKCIFASCTTECAILEDSAKELGTEELAHLVSCRACLERLSRQTGLAYVSERLSDDISNHDDRGPQGGTGGRAEILPLRSIRKGSQHPLLREVYARRQERCEHHPKEITLAFDGQSRATLLINASTNTLHLSLDSREVPDSIAVVSEQEFHLMILNQTELTCAERCVYRLPLSDDRFLEVTVTPETLGPSIQVVYEDPLYEPQAGAIEEQELKSIPAEPPMFVFPSEDAGGQPVIVRRWRTAWLGQLQRLFAGMNPLLTTAIASGAIALLCFVFWLRSAPPLSAGDLLDRAQKSERAATSSNRPGVIYEKVAIRTQRRTLERTIYRDAQGVRRPRHQALSSEDEQLKTRLANAGVDWDAPLSAADYSMWRHHSGATRDAVTNSGQHLLTLTTTPLAPGAVVKETLTVRDTDFHAVDRTVELRDNDTVEIAELNYDVLPWGAVNQDWFEPLAGNSPVLARMQPSLLLRLPSAEQLDLAELQARLALNRFQADSTEELEFVRSGSGVQVKGIVGTDARKHELMSALHLIPNVQLAIFSVDELRAHTSANDAVSSVRTYSTVAQPSPLEQFLRTQGNGIDSLNAVSRRLFDAALSIGQENRVLGELSRRFGAGSQLDSAGRLAYQQLLEAHLARLRSAADAEDAVLTEAGLNRAMVDATSVPVSADAVAAANLALCKELISGEEGPRRSATVIAGDLYRTTQTLRVSLESFSRERSSPVQASLPPSQEQ